MTAIKTAGSAAAANDAKWLWVVGAAAGLVGLARWQAGQTPDTTPFTASRRPGNRAMTWTTLARTDHQHRMCRCSIVRWGRINVFLDRIDVVSST